MKGTYIKANVDSVHEPCKPHGSRLLRSLCWLVLSLSIWPCFLLLVACSKTEQTYSNHTARFAFTATNLVPHLNAALNNAGEFCTITAHNNTYVFHSPGLREDFTYERSELERKSGYILGLSGLIVGTPVIAEQLSSQPTVVCFDLACPNCYEDFSITRNVTLQLSQRAQCSRCQRVYDLNTQGIIVEGVQGSSLYRYRVAYYPSGNTLNVSNY